MIIIALSGACSNAYIVVVLMDSFISRALMLTAVLVLMLVVSPISNVQTESYLGKSMARYSATK